MPVGPQAQRESLGTALALVVAAVAGIGYFLAWTLFPGLSGCGPPAHSTQGRVLGAAPFVLPVLAGVSLLVIASNFRRRRRTLLTGVLTTVGSAAALEFVIFIIEFGAHHCGE